MVERDEPVTGQAQVRLAHEPRRSILVVESDPDELAQILAILRSAGYRVAGASRFDEAKQMLAAGPPELLVAGVRLGAYNGLHLIVRSHADHPGMAAILTSHSLDPVLKAEADRQNASYILRPCSEQDLLTVVARSLGRNTAYPSHAGSGSRGSSDTAGLSPV